LFRNQLVHLVRGTCERMSRLHHVRDTPSTVSTPSILGSHVLVASRSALNIRGGFVCLVHVLAFRFRTTGNAGQHSEFQEDISIASTVNANVFRFK
jgi:hypothetical protein